MHWNKSVKQEIGGYDDIIDDIISSIQYNIQYKQCQMSPAKGVLLYGIPGCGKTSLAVTIAKYSELPYSILNTPDIFQTEEGVTELRLKEYFSSSDNLSLLIIDEIDIITAAAKNSLENRMASMIMHQLDQLENVFIIGLTSRLQSIDSCFLRSGRLDHIQALEVKSPEQRLAILTILSKSLPFRSDHDKHSLLSYISTITHGYVPSDLQSLCSEVIFQLIKEDNQDHLSLHHFTNALKSIKPSNLNEFVTKLPNITFNDIYGINDIIHEIKISVIQPFQHPDKYIQLGISPPKGILLHGPTGVGKTMLCSALASEVGINYMLVESSQIRSKIVGESEKGIAKLFALARSNSPCILFIDQIDMLLPKRGTSHSSENTADRIVTSFLTEMDGLLTKQSKDNTIDLLIIAATSRIEAIDPAVLRPGRFDEHIYIPLPNDKQRYEIIKGISSKMPIDLTEHEISSVVDRTHSWSGAELDNLFREAAMVSLRDNINNRKITLSNINQALLQHHLLTQ
ncbi:P-loop containing nucleoside triphosphate hydrolase protein [Pilobolus umbonatus]|nr:P-loop containing nucleoside triphosphate hydrolase protein [Pilobolus umbonatus]